MRLLLIDDEPTLAVLFARLARHLGVELASAVSADVGLAAIDQGGFDILICDRHLDRGRSGLPLLERAKARSPSALLVLASGDGSAEGLPRGVVQLLKPYGLSELAALIDLARARARGV